MLAFVVILATTDLNLPSWSLYGIGGLLFGLIATGTLVVPAYWWRMERADRREAEERERATYRELTEKLLTGLDKLEAAGANFRAGSDLLLRALERITSS